MRTLPRILVFGADGQVARELGRELATLGELVIVGRSTPGLCADFAAPASLAAVVAKLRPQLIVNAAAFTAVDRAESEPVLADAVNAVAPGVIATAARNCGAALVHYSTDYVFDGTATVPYRETDAPRPQSAYGRSKLAGETAIRESGVPHLILRTSWVYGLHGQNFMRTMRRLARERDELRVVADQRGAPTWSRHIAQATAQMAAQLGVDPQAWQRVSGTYHLVSGGETSWHGFAERIVAHQRLHEPVKAQRVTPIATHEYPLPAPRPAYSVLNTDKLLATFGLRLPDWQTALAQVQQELDQERF